MKSLKTRDVLFQEGESDGKLYIVRRGNLVIQKKEGAKVQSEGTVGPETVVGEESLLLGKPHPYTLRATENVEAEEYSEKDLADALQKLPTWFKPFLNFLAQRSEKLERNKSLIDKIHALPSLLFLCAKALRYADDGQVELFPLLEDLKTLNGIGQNKSFSLLRAVCSLGIAELLPGESLRIRFYRRRLPELLYRALLARKSRKTLPKSLLSASEQTILTAFISAAKTKGLSENGETKVFAKHFFSTFQTLFPGMRLSRRHFENLSLCGYLRTTPPLKSASDISNVESFSADLESVKDLVELNRVYPLLDKGLLRAMESP